MRRRTISVDKRVMEMILEKKHEMERVFVRPVSMNEALVALMYDFQAGVKTLPQDLKKEYILRNRSGEPPP